MLDDEAIARYARQIVIPGIGAAGQEKLLAATVLVVGNARGVRQASLYLAASGVLVATSLSDTIDFDVAVVADIGAIDESTRTSLVTRGSPVCWYRVDEHGFTTGVHPPTPLPVEENARLNGGRGHDAAACDVAGLAAAIVAGLPCRRETTPFDGETAASEIATGA